VSTTRLTRRPRLGCVVGAALATTVAVALGLTVVRRAPVLAARRVRGDLTHLPPAPSVTSGARSNASSCAEQVQVRLFFGLFTPEGAVSDVEWARFLADVVTPRFPRGLTVVNAAGQWRGPRSDDITKEPSRIVEIVDEASPETDRRVHEIVAIYSRQYRQESVMLTRGRVDACF
jgi:hypothetical protein